MENMSYSGPEANSKPYDSALRHEVSVSSVSGGEDTNPAWTSEIGNEEFSGAIKQSLAAQGLLSDNGRYQLAVNLSEVDQDLFGLDLTVVTKVKYTLIDSRNTNMVMDETITTPYTATFGDAVLAFERLRLANEGAAKKNIEELLDTLSALRISDNQVSMD
jgi:hypothetical protein